MIASIISLTEAASTKVREFLAAQNRDDLALRIYVKPGGCSGFSYGMGLDEAHEDDSVSDVGGIRVVVDPQSFRFVQGAQVDYKDAMLGGGFAITNPNAEATCGCGSSFRPKEEGAEDAEGAPAGCGGCC